jgi:hypothetical protein
MVVLANDDGVIVGGEHERLGANIVQVAQRYSYSELSLNSMESCSSEQTRRTTAPILPQRASRQPGSVGDRARPSALTIGTV